MDFSAQLLEVLQLSQNADTTLRRNAEATLRQWIYQDPEFSRWLVAIAARRDVFPHIRQLAIIVLAQHVTKSARNMSPERISEIVSFSFHSMASEENTLVRKSSAVLLAKYCSVCNNTDFQNIINTLQGCLTYENLNLLLITCKCLYEIATEVQYYRHITMIKSLYERLITIFRACDRNMSQMIRYIVRILRTCVESVGQCRVSYGMNDEEIQMVQSFIVSWSQEIICWIQQCPSLDAILSTEIAVYIELLRSLTVVIECFPDECSEVVGQSLQASWGILHGIKDIYIWKFVSGTDVDSEDRSGYTSDGDRIDIDVLVSYAFELLTVGVSMTEIDLTSMFGANLELMLGIVASFVQLSRNLMHAVDSDGNEFITDEQEESFEFQLRANGAEMLTTICKIERSKAYFSIFLFAKAELQKYSTQPTLSYSDQLWLEAVMYCMCSISESYVKRYKKLTNKILNSPNRGNCKIDFPGIEEVSGVVGSYYYFITRSQQCSVFLKARAAIMVSKYKSLFPVDSIVTVIREISLMIAQCSNHAAKLQFISAIGIITAKKIESYATQSSESTVIISESDVQTLLISIASTLQACSDSTIHIPLGSLQLVVKMFGNLASKETLFELGKSAFFIMGQYQNDSYIVMICQLLFNAILSTSETLALSATRDIFLPYFQSMCVSGEHSVPFHLWQMASDDISKISSFQFSSSEMLQSIMNVKVEILYYLSNAMESISSPSKLREVMKSVLVIFSSSLSAYQDFPRYMQSDRLIQLLQRCELRIMQVLEAARSKDSSMENLGLIDCISPCVGLVSVIVTFFYREYSPSRLFSFAMLTFVDCESPFVKNAIMMCMIHIAARKCDIFLSSLAEVQTMPGLEDSTAQLLSYWTQTHSTLSSLYCLRISSLGLIQLLNNIQHNAQLQSLILAVIKSLLKSLKIFYENQNKENILGESLSFEPGNNDLDEENSIDDSDDEDSHWSVNIETDVNGVSREEEDKYSSEDAYYAETGDANDGEKEFDLAVTNISDRLLFDPPSLDPLARLPVIETIVGQLAKYDFSENNALSVWTLLSEDERSAIRNLLIR